MVSSEGELHDGADQGSVEVGHFLRFEVRDTRGTLQTSSCPSMQSSWRGW